MKRIAVISPFYNEGEGLREFLRSLEAAFKGLDCKVVFFLIDDGSTDDSASTIKEFAGSGTGPDLHLISLEFNTGHQTAIYEGLKIAEVGRFDNYMILDSDGQDDLSAIPTLLAKASYDIVWVRRTARAEGIPFRTAYYIYRFSYRLITGRKIDFGNFSIISHRVARYLIVRGFVHYPTALLTSPFSKSFVTAKRLARPYGRSKMATKDLVHHAFLSFVEDSEVIVGFFLKSTLVILVIFLLSIGNILYQKFIAHTAILGWTSVTSIGLLNLAFLSFGLFALSLSIIRIGKSNAPEQKIKCEEIAKTKRSGIAPLDNDRDQTNGYKLP